MTLRERFRRFFREDGGSGSERPSPQVQAAYRELENTETVKKALRSKLEAAGYSPSDAILGRSVLRSELKKANRIP